MSLSRTLPRYEFEMALRDMRRTVRPARMPQDWRARAAQLMAERARHIPLIDGRDA